MSSTDLIVEFIARHGPASAAQIAIHLGMTDRDAQRLLHGLVQAGVLFRRPKGSAYIYRIAKSQANALDVRSRVDREGGFNAARMYAPDEFKAARGATIEECANKIVFCGECDCPFLSQKAILALAAEPAIGKPDDVLRTAIREACDLLAERTYGSPARSPGHNARLRLEAALTGTPETAADRPRTSVGRPRAFLAWAVDIFGSVTKLRYERLMRFVEEAIELAHADGMGREMIDTIAYRVYSRERGDINKEIGQAQACLEMYAENIGESADQLAQAGWERVQKIPREEWERRHAAKVAIGIATASPERVDGAAGFRP